MAAGAYRVNVKLVSFPLLLLWSLFRAWRTLEPRDWSIFADGCLRVAKVFSRHSFVWMVAGHALKAAERSEEARNAFEIAIGLKGDSARSFLGLGQVLKALGRRTEALEAFETAWRLGARERAARQLCRYGAREDVPGLVSGIFPVRDYAVFIERHPVLPPSPLPTPSLQIFVYIDARAADTEAVRRTVDSLKAQSWTNWMGRIFVSSLRAGDGEGQFLSDSRLMLATDHSDSDSALPHGSWVLPLVAGVALDQHAMAWISWTISNTRCTAIYGDHDHYVADTSGNRRRVHPVLHPMRDDIWFKNSSHKPAVMVFRSNGNDGTGVFAIFERAPAVGQPTAHIPRVLASVPFTPAREHSHTPARGQGRISIIIPTRDNAALLRPCIETLVATADRVDRLEFLIVDNGSVQQESKALFAGLFSSHGAKIVPFDEAFNWSRANNVGAEKATGEHLLFLNDDTEMLTAGWDSLMSGLLERDESAGIIGVRMLYPDRTIQHAGFVFGMDNGPQHEGRWMPAADPGPQGRWAKMRKAVAVTGAFMAMRRSVYDEVGRFDEGRYAVDFSDVDMCLRAREKGYAVIYAPDITLLHHESVSRGYNRSRRKRKRARGEAAVLRANWGTVLDQDPGYNLYWTRQGCSFDGFREPSPQEIMAHIRQSAQLDPWWVERSNFRI
jgi:GT2 family glycosyltransferase